MKERWIIISYKLYTLRYERFFFLKSGSKPKARATENLLSASEKRGGLEQPALRRVSPPRPHPCQMQQIQKEKSRQVRVPIPPRSPATTFSTASPAPEVIPFSGMAASDPGGGDC